MTSSQTIELFPETQGVLHHEEWFGCTKDKFGYPLITVRLLPKWEAKTGWQVGWFIHADNAVDEWHPDNPDRHKCHANYPWYRLDSLPTSNKRDIALAIAGRAAKIVLEQMLPYIQPALHAELKDIQEAIETQSRAWLQ